MARLTKEDSDSAAAEFRSAERTNIPVARKQDVDTIAAVLDKWLDDEFAKLMTQMPAVASNLTPRHVAKILLRVLEHRIRRRV